jgi:hypothetical protein
LVATLVATGSGFKKSGYTTVLKLPGSPLTLHPGCARCSVPGCRSSSFSSPPYKSNSA